MASLGVQGSPVSYNGSHYQGGSGMAMANPQQMQNQHHPVTHQHHPPVYQPIKPGTIPPGTLVQIGEHQVEVERFLSEGGFAHVYVVRSSQPIPPNSSTTQHVLKRVAVPDKETLRDVRWEVDVMKLLRGHKHIVNLIEASASPIPGTTGYEIFILMEFCAGGGIIDMMNTRLQNRLTESEILKIFSDVVEAVCWMHTREPPLLHRDLKVENILLAAPNLYKLCDFGSTTCPQPRPPQTMQEIQLLEAELNKHTTLQYRAPEMCDVWSRKGVGLPADVWALGVLLYKLCFYTTPFEEQGPLAILNVQYKMPSYPAYSNDIRNLIASMLVENAVSRPVAFEVHREVSRLRGVPFKSEYQSRARQKIPPTPSPAFNGLSSPLPARPLSSVDYAGQQPGHSDGSVSASSVVSSTISPMRRGRPAKPPTHSASTSNLMSEWHVSPVESSVGNRSPALTGFGDSFNPSTKIYSNQSRQQPESGFEEIETPQSKTALATAALFEELSSPGSTVKPVPTLANLAAARERTQSAVPTIRGSEQANAVFLSPNSRVSAPSKPLGPRPQLPKAHSSFASTAAVGNSMPTPSPALSAVVSMSGKGSSNLSSKEAASAELKTGDISSATLSTKSKLLSRQSQVENDWLIQQKEKQGEREMSANVLSAISSPKQEGGEDSAEMKHFPSIDAWESAGFSPPENPSAWSQKPNQGQKEPVRNLLEEDEEGVGQAANIEGNAPILSVLSGPSQDGHLSSISVAGPAEPQAQKEKSDGTKSVPKIERHSSSVSASSSIAPMMDTGMLSKSPQSIAVIENQARIEQAPGAADSSDDEDGPEDASGRRYVSAVPAVPRKYTTESDSSTNAGSGNFDIEPALSSIRKFAPTNGAKQAGPPPILAPKPRNAGIMGMVSHYESISSPPLHVPSTSGRLDLGATISAPTTSKLPPSAPNKAPKPENLSLKPIKPPKPASSSKPRVSSTSSMDDFVARFPALDDETEGPSPSSAVKPSRNTAGLGETLPGPSVNATSSQSGPQQETKLPKVRPVTMHFPTPPPEESKAVVKGRTYNAKVDEEEQDEGFRGVENLRSRWQKNIDSQSMVSGSSPSGVTPLYRRTSTLNNAGGARLP